MKEILDNIGGIINHTSFTFTIIFIYLVLMVRKLIDKDMLKNLLAPNSVFALIIYLTFAIMSLRGQINANIVENVVIMIVSFYFGKKTAEANGGGQ
jgi:hypothetical protein